MKTRKQYDEKIAELIAERDALPPDLVLADLEPGIYAFNELGSVARRYFIKGIGGCWSNAVFGNGQLATDACELQSYFDEGTHRFLVKLCDLDAKPLEKIDVDWKLIDKDWAEPLEKVNRVYVGSTRELLKVVKWARPLLEGK